MHKTHPLPIITERKQTVEGYMHLAWGSILKYQHMLVAVYA
jgi:hypothetical protein